MKKWTNEEGLDFSNSRTCFGKEFSPGSGQINIATITINGDFPESGWSYNEEAHEMAIIASGSGWVQVKGGEKVELSTGDVVYLEPLERFRWGGNMDLIVPCSPAFDPDKHHLEDK